MGEKPFCTAGDSGVASCGPGLLSWITRRSDVRKFSRTMGLRLDHSLQAVVFFLFILKSARFLATRRGRQYPLRELSHPQQGAPSAGVSAFRSTYWRRESLGGRVWRRMFDLGVMVELHQARWNARLVVATACRESYTERLLADRLRAGGVQPRRAADFGGLLLHLARVNYGLGSVCSSAVRR